MQDRLWTLKEYPFHPEKLRYYETIFTIGNGYLGTRASFEEGYPDETPATLIHGLFNQAPGTPVPELVNAPNWTAIHLTVDGTPFRLLTETSNKYHPPEGLVLGYERKLHMDGGVLHRTVLFRAATGATVRIHFERFASLDDPHVLVQRVVITAIDGAPELTIETILNGDVSNNGTQHWGMMQPSTADNLTALYGVTNQSGYTLAMASKLVSPQPVRYRADGKAAVARSTMQLQHDGEVIFDRITAVYTSRDVPDVREAAYEKVQYAVAQGYEALYAGHRAAWDTYWQAADIRIEGDDAAQIAARFCTYHVLIAAPGQDDDVSIGAKTLSGLGYKGHVFWDTELFMLPLLTLTLPHIARNMLMYRYRRLSGAREKARHSGYEGAMFPWESTDTGLETTPLWSEDLDRFGNPLRIWTGEHEQHISTDIAYGVLQYWRWTGDHEFLAQYGAEIVLDTAVFWGSRAQAVNGRYELHDQIGPDEYHENINNSVFVNQMVVWHLQEALDLLDWLKSNAPEDTYRLIRQLDLNEARLAGWRDIIASMVIPFDDEKQVHIQFDGFFDLNYIPVQKYEPRVGGIWQYLGHERALESQLIKQADVVMLMALLGDAVGSREIMLNNWHTYYPRCDHGSSLSPSVHAWVAARLGLDDEACHMFDHAAAIDLEDNKGNVHQGIHGAASGGLWQAIVFGFCGLHLTESGPAAAPNLPAHWKSVTFNIRYRGNLLRFSISQ